jgi:hypothetical protein
MKIEIKVGTWWKYIGPGEGRNTTHRITSASKDEVTTWTDPNAPGSCGYAWLGDENEFIKNFRPVA